jgi:hypothetical protein
VLLVLFKGRESHERPRFVHIQILWKHKDSQLIPPVAFVLRLKNWVNLSSIRFYCTPLYF